MTTPRLRDALDVLAEARAQRQAEPVTASVSLFDESLPMFDPPGDLANVTQGIESVHAHTTDEWKRDALDAVRAAAQLHQQLTVEDVRWPPGPEPYDDRARGGVMRQAARAGLIESTHTYRPSDRPETHRRPLLVWRSRRGEGNEA